MAQKEHSLFNKIILLALICFFAACSDIKKEEEKTTSSFFVDTTLIPNDTVLVNAENLKLDNGVYYLNNKPFSGYDKKLLSKWDGNYDRWLFKWNAAWLIYQLLS